MLNGMNNQSSSLIQISDGHTGTVLASRGNDGNGKIAWRLERGASERWCAESSTIGDVLQTNSPIYESIEKKQGSTFGSSI